MKIFIDANIFVAACGSDTGASRYLFNIAIDDPTYQLLTSRYALDEAQRNVSKKMAQQLGMFWRLVAAPALTIVHPPPETLIAKAEAAVRAKDAPIVAAAIFARAEVLCTLDRRDLHTVSVKRWCQSYGLYVLLPGEVIARW